MIYGRSHRRMVEDPDFDCGSGVCIMHWKPALGRRSKRHQMRQQDSWRTSEARTPFSMMTTALHIRFETWLAVFCSAAQTEREAQP